MCYALTAINILHAQIILDFEAGNLVNWEEVPANRWEISATGTITGTGSLHHAFDNAEGGRDAISTSLYPLRPDSGLTIWRFQVKHGYTPSGSNNWGVFLLADASASEMAPGGAINGYVLGVNYSGTDDIIKLWEITEGSANAIINTGINWQSSVGTGTPAGFQVSRTQSGEWQLETDTNGGFDNLISSGSAISGNHHTAKFFGVSFEYSSTQDQQLWLDDISIQGSFIPDETPPYIEKIEVLDSNQITIHFSENIDTIFATQPDNYLVNGSLQPEKIKIENMMAVSLTFATPFPEGDSSLLAIAAMADIHGNTANNLESKFLYFKIKKGDIIINEIMADPTPPVDLPEYEYVELYNNSPFAVNLRGWSITAGSTTKTIPAFLLLPDAYLVLTHESAVEEFEETTMGIFTSTSTLANSGTTITLATEDNEKIDAVSYSNTWYKDDTKSSGGWSLERIDPGNTCLEEENWVATSDISGGTPGRENAVKADLTDTEAPSLVYWNFENDSSLILKFSEAIAGNFIPDFFKPEPGLILSTIEPSGENKILLTFSESFTRDSRYSISISNLQDRCGNNINDTTLNLVFHVPQAGDLIINEIMADPDPSQGLPDGEYVEIYNRSAYPLPLRNWRFSSGATFKSFPDIIIPSGSYLIITHEEFIDLYADFGMTIGLFSSTSTLTNGGSLLTVFAPDSAIINQVNWDNEWYRNPEKAEGGWSLERIDPDNLCSGGENWTASETISGGTPGETNSVFARNLDSIAPTIVSAFATSYQEVLIRFSEAIPDTILLKKEFYQLNNETSFILDRLSDAQAVSLHFQDSLTGEILLTISGITDACGNLMKDTSLPLYFYPVQPYAVIISEIMANPSPSVLLPEVEYIEIFNHSTHPYQLKDWILTTGTAERTLPAAVLQPGEYSIVCNMSDAWYFDAKSVIGVEGFNTLPNSGTVLVLSNSEGKTIHAINYDESWYGNEFKMNGGWSLEMMDVQNPCGERENWMASEDERGGTPGEINSVNVPNADQTKPQLLRAGIINDSTVLIYFSEALDSATLISNTYSLDPAVDEEPIVKPVAPFFNQAELFYQHAFEPGTTYTLSVTGSIADCAGNRNEQIEEISFSLPENADTFDIIINEILFNPLPDGSDYVEIYNRSGKVIDLANMLIASFDEQTFSYSPSYYISDQSYLFTPGSFVVLSEKPEAVRLHYHVSDALEQNFIQLKNLPSFPDAAGRVALLTKTGKVIDDFAYDEDMHFQLLDVTEGISLERINPDWQTNLRNNWHSAAETAGFGTPGRVNSQFSENTPVHEESFALSPEIFSPDNDGTDDIASLSYNLSRQGFVANITVYDASGRVIHKIAQNYLLGTSGRLTWDGTRQEGTRCPPGIYLFYIEIFHPDGEVQKYKKSVVLSYRR